MNEEQDFLAQAEQVRQEQVAAQQGEVDPAVQASVDHAQQTSGSATPGDQPGFMGLGGLSAGEIEAQKADIAQQRYAASAPGEAAPPPGTETAPSAPAAGSQEPGFTGLGGLSADDIEAQKQDIAEQRFAAPPPSPPSPAEAGRLADPEGLMDEAEQAGSSQDFLAEAGQVRQEQLAGKGPVGDPAVQSAIDHATQTAGSGPEPGSEEPGFMGLGGLSSAEIEAQKQDIARERYRGG